MKTPNQILTTLILLLLTSTILIAQPRNGERKEQIQAMKIAFFTKALSLTPEEAEKFWPIYNQYSDELEQLKKERKKNRTGIRDGFEGMSDKEVEEAVDRELVFQQQEVDIRKSYHTQFKKVLPVRKVARLYKAEVDFKRTLLKKIKENRQNAHPGRGGPKR